MRGALAMLAALALAACQVEVEGARCSGAGTSADCPEGQACGNDGRCSERAAACAASRCNPGASRCGGATLTEFAEACTTDDPVCGSWQRDPCAAKGLRCATRGGGPSACECPSNPSAELAADPLGSPSGALPYPTGLPTPRECRFQSLGDALAAAAAHGGAVTVRAYGDTAAPVVFGNATGETYPLVVPEDVTLVAASAPAGETVIRGDAATGATIVAVSGGTIEGVRIANVSMTGNGTDLTCGATAPPTLRDVTVSAGPQKLAKGMTITGSCGATLERVEVSGASGPALQIDVTATATVTAKGSRFHGSGVGIQAKGGILWFEPDGATPTEVTDNDGNGIVLGNGVLGDSTTIEATLLDVLVARNGGTGLLVNTIPVTSKLTMTTCDVHSNGTASPAQYGPPPPGRRAAGGILLSQVSLGRFQLRGNTVYANHGTSGADELAIESSDAWTLTTGDCTSPAPNAFGCVKDGSRAVSVWPGTVDAGHTIWPTIPPAETAGPGVTFSNACGMWSGTCPP